MKLLFAAINNGNAFKIKAAIKQTVNVKTLKTNMFLFNVLYDSIILIWKLLPYFLFLQMSRHPLISPKYYHN
jgi:hypothetical protein